MSRRILNPQCFIWIWLAAMLSPVVSQAEIDFFQTPAEQKSSIRKNRRQAPWVQNSQGPILHCSGM